jgi:hypothetical protein
MESLLVLERLQTETNKAICRPIAKSFEDQANKFLDDSIEFSNQLIDITKILAEANKFFIIELNTMSRMDTELFERFLKFKRSLIRLIDKVKNSIFYKVVKPQLDELIIEKDEFDEIIYDFQLKTEILPKSSKMSDLMKRLAAQA